MLFLKQHDIFFVFHVFSWLKFVTIINAVYLNSTFQSTVPYSSLSFSEELDKFYELLFIYY